MKTTIYELLGMVKDGKAPKKVKYKDKIYYYHEGYDFNYMYNSSDYSPMDRDKSLFTFNSFKMKDGRQCWEDKAAIDFLNDKVEIIEEEKKIPEKLEEFGIQYNLDYIDYKNIETLKKWLNKDFQTIYDTLDLLIKNQNKLIDYLKSKGE